MAYPGWVDTGNPHRGVGGTTHGKHGQEFSSCMCPCPRFTVIVKLCSFYGECAVCLAWRGNTGLHGATIRSPLIALEKALGAKFKRVQSASLKDTG